MNKIIKVIFLLTLSIVSLNSYAQSAGDKLFSQGQKLQMVQTVSSQNQAIAKFSAAKKAYDSLDKKAMCDNQIKICKNNIATIKKKDTVVKEVVVKKDSKKERNKQLNKEPDDEVVIVHKPVVKKDPVSLSLSVSTIEFKSGGKKSDNHEVVVNCNYDNWTYKAPDWINITKNGEKLLLTAAENENGEERSDVLVVECEGVKAEVMVYQKAKMLDNIKNTAKKLNPFKKKNKD